MKLSCIYSNSYKALNLLDSLNKRYEFVPFENCDAIVCLGGDGFMLHSIHRFHKLNKPIYGINCGSLGFFLNTYDTRSD